MRNCPYCKIDVAGSRMHCPLCQNELMGEPSADVWPWARSLQKRSLFYKIQLFLVLSTVVIFLIVDFNLGKHGEGQWHLLRFHGVRHWSLLVLLWVIVTEKFLKRLLRGEFIISKHTSLLFYYAAILFMVTGWYCDFWRTAIGVVVPILCCVVMGWNLILSAFDKSGNVMVYMLSSIFVGIVPCGVFLLYDGVIPVAWSVAMMISLICLIAMLIFKGRAMMSEIMKRFNV